eukprot:TRINITY_DN13955_c0_g1_i1.p1 TRINITY_DN13955_c0_g1~~TRINITY_DN13955_c0_g1_i1.p1  ORF type:complete len:321 (+),score=97.08 TRINITY_DN13955_c0_g1_i1:124-1086(+)
MEDVCPMINFSMIAPGVYRSGYPSRRNFSFLRRVGIRNICYLCPEEYARQNQEFYKQIGIAILKFPMEGNKEPFVNIPEEVLNRALSAVCNTSNHPILIHCNKGMHRTGCVCGCLRKLMGWSLVSIFGEYNRFAGSKGRAMDETFIEMYQPRVSIAPSCLPSWLDKDLKYNTPVGDPAPGGVLIIRSDPMPAPCSAAPAAAAARAPAPPLAAGAAPPSAAAIYAVVAAAAALTRVHSGGAPGHRPQQPSPRQAGAAQRVALCAQQLCALGEADWRTLLHAAYSAFVPCLATGVGSVAAALAPFFARAAPTCAPPGNPAAR